MEYKSCNLLEHGICFYVDRICSCCYAPQEKVNDSPFLAALYKGELINKDLLFELINRWKNKAKQGELIDCCSNCYKAETKDWSDENYIDQVYISHFQECNSKCVYCITDILPENRVKNPYKILPVLDDMKQKGILKEGCEFHIGGGEFTIYSECEDLIKKYILSGFAKRLAVASNGIKYSNALYQAMCIDKGVIIISLDCGSRELFNQIKKVDKFNIVLKNISKYTKDSISRRNTFLKYIVIPSLNDNKDEFSKFIEISKKYQVQGIKLDIEGHYCRYHKYKLNRDILAFLEWAKEYTISNGVDFEGFSFYNQCISN